MISQRRTQVIGLTLAVAAALFFLVAWPIAELLRVAAEQLPADAASIVSWRVVMNTVIVGAASAVVTVVIGVAGALLTERSGVPGRKWLRLGFLLPVLIPPFVSALSWMRAYGPGGLIDDIFGVSLPGLFGPAGIILVISVNAMPLAYLLTVAALNSRAGADLELAGRVSGATPMTVARTVTLPLLAPALGGAGSLVFVIGINAFGVPAFLGSPASFETVTTRIYQDLARSARPESFSRAILLATGLVLAAFVFVLIGEGLLSRIGAGRFTSGAAGPGVRYRKAGRPFTVLAWTAIVMATLLPLVALLLAAATKGVGVTPTPNNWTVDHFAEAVDGRLLGALGRSIGLAIAAATLGLILGASVTVLRRRRLGRSAGIAVLVGFAVPGSTLAVAMILSYGSFLRGTLLIILLAYLAKLWAVSHRTLVASSDNLPDELLFAGRISGASSGTVLRTITIPMLRPAMFGAWALVFLIGFHELTMSSLLYGPGTETVAVAILNLQQLGDVPVSSALAAILTVPLLVVFLPILLTKHLSHRFLGTR